LKIKNYLRPRLAKQKSLATRLEIFYKLKIKNKKLKLWKSPEGKFFLQVTIELRKAGDRLTD